MNLSGNTILITGGSEGVGFELASAYPETRKRLI